MEVRNFITLVVNWYIFCIILLLELKVINAQINSTRSPPERTTRHYDPNYGREPYWPKGEWVLYGDPAAPKTTVPVLVGPDECEEMYRDIKAVCGRRVSHDNVWNRKCSWVPCQVYGYGDEYYRYRSFPTYCHFLDAEYRSKEKERYIFVHLGECIHQDKYFYDMWYGSDVWVRAHHRALALNQAFARVGQGTTWPCGRLCNMEYANG